MAMQLTEDQESMETVERVCLEFEDDYWLGDESGDFPENSIVQWRMAVGLALRCRRNLAALGLGLPKSI